MTPTIIIGDHQKLFLNNLLNPSHLENNYKWTIKDHLQLNNILINNLDIIPQL